MENRAFAEKLLKLEKMFGSPGGLLTIAMYPHRETANQVNLQCMAPSSHTDSQFEIYNINIFSAPFINKHVCYYGRSGIYGIMSCLVELVLLGRAGRIFVGCLEDDSHFHREPFI